MKNIPRLSGTRNTTVTEATPHCFTRQTRSKVKQSNYCCWSTTVQWNVENPVYVYIMEEKMIENWATSEWINARRLVWNIKQKMWLRDGLFFLSCASIGDSFGFWLGSDSLARYIFFVFTTVKTIGLLWLPSDITGTFSTTYSVGNVCNLRRDNHMAGKVFGNKCVCYTTVVCAVGSLPCWGGARKTCRSSGLTEEERIL